MASVYRLEPAIATRTRDRLSGRRDQREEAMLLVIPQTEQRDLPGSLHLVLREEVRYRNSQ